jgi:hypothetical protein
VAKLRAEVYYLEPDSPLVERSCPNPRLDRALHGVTSLTQPCTLTRGNLPKHTFLFLMLLFVAGGSASSPIVPSDAQYKHHDFWQRQLSTSSWTPVQAIPTKVAGVYTIYTHILYSHAIRIHYAHTLCALCSYSIHSILIHYTASLQGCNTQDNVESASFGDSFSLRMPESTCWWCCW